MKHTYLLTATLPSSPAPYWTYLKSPQKNFRQKCTTSYVLNSGVTEPNLTKVLTISGSNSLSFQFLYSMHLDETHKNTKVVHIFTIALVPSRTEKIQIGCKIISYDNWLSLYKINHILQKIYAQILQRSSNAFKIWNVDCVKCRLA